ncbi:MAG TPA: LLM class F420-dependent oxidoreductase [Candidatus Binatia bacterium]|nr:LLM class F420-dependent oxidoreductase [Candidatus Binatia bacterium]
MRCALILHMNRVTQGSPFVTADGVGDVARAAEAAGFDAVAVTDHPLPTVEWMASGGHHALDPLVTLAVVAAATRRLRLLTYVYVLPYRNPFLTAKAVASLDVLSGGRVTFGVAAGYLEPEFTALGVPFAERDTRCDEAIRAMKAAWTEDPIDFAGSHFAARGHTVEPRPVQRPHPPLWVGGNSRKAIRRAVTLADGWMPIYNPPRYAARRRTPPMESPADVRARLAFAAETAAAAGRTAPFEVVWTAQGLGDFGTPRFERGRFLDGIGALGDAGVTYFTVHLPGRTPAEQADHVARFGADFLR